MSQSIVKVTSPSFSTNSRLCEELFRYFPSAVVNKKKIRFQGESLVNYLKDADAAIIGLETIDKTVIDSCPNLRFIGKYGVGLDNIDLEYCRRRNVVVGWTPGVNRRSVAEEVLCFLLGLSRNIFFSNRKLMTGVWEKEGGFLLSGKTVGIIGLGNTGSELVRLLQPFGCKILVNDIVPNQQFISEYNLIKADKETLIRKSDFVSLHVPLTTETQHLINRKTLKKMKPTAFLVNTSRGDVVDQEALREALANNVIAGAALDVFSEEPLVDQALIDLPNLVVTPHIGGNAEEAVYAMGKSAIDHLVNFHSEKASVG